MKRALLLPLVFMLTACEGSMNDFATDYLKSTLEEACGAKHLDCVLAVQEQFYACQNRHRDEWQSYVSFLASGGEDALSRYPTQLFSCIVDRNGAPYFYFDSQRG